MRKIYLHIGCGKTGSSAIQVWLHQNHEKLLLEGIHYPIFGQEINNPYKITSGNGVSAVKAIKSKNSYKFFKNLSEKLEGNILLSSESFQGLNKKETNEIKSIFEILNLSPVIIIYLRDVYDIMFSGYNQLVKRHLMTKHFHEWASEKNSIQQFQVLETWESEFKTINAIHYDTNKNDLDILFLKSIDISNKNFPRMDRKKVNRSLTFSELNLLRLLNEIYSDKFNNKDFNFSRIISDSFIMNSPEKDTSIYYDKNIEVFLQNKFENKIREINNKYFNGKETLCVFRHEGKNISNSYQEIDKDYEITIREIFKMIDKFNTRNSQINETVKKVNKKNQSISLVVDFLKEEAIKYEKKDIKYSFNLMRAAQTLRPSGPMINKKIDEYKKILFFSSKEDNLI